MDFDKITDLARQRPHGSNIIAEALLLNRDITPDQYDYLDNDERSVGGLARDIFPELTQEQSYLWDEIQFNTDMGMQPDDAVAFALEASNE